MKNTVAPYIVKNLKRIERKVQANQMHRIQRFRSPVFVLPEFASQPAYSLLDFAEGKATKTENWAMTMNRLSKEQAAKIVFILPSKEIIGSAEITEIVRSISESEWNLGVLFGDAQAFGFAVSSDTFQLARGLDELIELPSEAIADVALRLELLGVMLHGKERLHGQKSINVEKGELLVNFGSANFPNLYFEGN
jgi:hypothetical protein